MLDAQGNSGTAQEDAGVFSFNLKRDQTRNWPASQPATISGGS
jgi:hypothetical protein